jgi:hypothetical protein
VLADLGRDEAPQHALAFQMPLLVKVDQAVRRPLARTPKVTVTLGQSEYFLFAMIAIFLASAVIPIAYLAIKELRTRQVFEKTLDHDERERLNSFRSIGLPWREFRAERNQRHRKKVAPPHKSFMR